MYSEISRDRFLIVLFIFKNEANLNKLEIKFNVNLYENIYVTNFHFLILPF
jgi:hypothetical protein